MIKTQTWRSIFRRKIFLRENAVWILRCTVETPHRSVIRNRPLVLRALRDRFSDTPAGFPKERDCARSYDPRTIISDLLLLTRVTIAFKYYCTSRICYNYRDNGL